VTTRPNQAPDFGLCSPPHGNGNDLHAIVGSFRRYSHCKTNNLAQIQCSSSLLVKIHGQGGPDLHTSPSPEMTVRKKTYIPILWFFPPQELLSHNELVYWWGKRNRNAVHNDLHGDRKHVGFLNDENKWLRWWMNLWSISKYSMPRSILILSRDVV